MELTVRHPQEVIASFPSHIALDGRKIGLSSLIYVRPGEAGYYPLPLHLTDLIEADKLMARRFNARFPSEAEREAAMVGSMFGWGVPGADPLNCQTEAD